MNKKMSSSSFSAKDARKLHSCYAPEGKVKYPDAIKFSIMTHAAMCYIEIDLETQEKIFIEKNTFRKKKQKRIVQEKTNFIYGFANQ